MTSNNYEPSPSTHLVLGKPYNVMKKAVLTGVWLMTALFIHVFFASSQQIMPPHGLNEIGVTPTSIGMDVDYIVKLLIAVLILGMGWLISFTISSASKRYENASLKTEKAYDSLNKAVNSLTLETRLQRESLSVHRKDIDILKRRFNQIKEKVTHHERHHMKCRTCPIGTLKFKEDEHLT